MASVTTWTTCLPSTESMPEIDALAALQVENARLIGIAISDCASETVMAVDGKEIVPAS